MKYLNDPRDKCIGSQILPCIHFKNEIDSFLIFLVIILLSTFLCEHGVHEKSLD